MKFIHIADLHIGKRVNDFSMIDDQRHILGRVLEIIDSEKPDAVLIAGDVYDKPLPSAEAVSLFDDFISSLACKDTRVMIISGNHDSPERLSFGSRIMDKSGIYFTGVYDGDVHKVTLEDEYGSVNFYMLPFIKPSYVRAAFPDDEEAAEIASYTEAAKFAIEKMGVNDSERNILIAHQFVTGGERSDSEDISIGGAGNIDSDVFELFDYTALGHLHRPQNIGCEKIRYAGSPLKYSFSEANHNKSVTIAEIGKKPDGVQIRESSLIPIHEMKEIKGRYNELTDKNYYKHIDTDNYFRIILTDEEDVIGALQTLRSIYPNTMRLEYDNRRTRASTISADANTSEDKSPIEIFESFYSAQNGNEMGKEQRKLVTGLIERIWSEKI